MKETGQIQFFCRIRSTKNQSDVSHIKVLSDKIISLTPPSASVAFQNGIYREIHCSFHHVFDEGDSQETVFEQTTVPLITDVFRRKSCLLFAYGLSGSGKTYTMNGEPRNPGIISRTLEVIFNNIMHLQAEKFVFKPDKMNGFDVQTEEDARKERQCEAAAYMKSARPQRVTKYACMEGNAIFLFHFEFEIIILEKFFLC
jgi:kinesin family protein 23